MKVPQALWHDQRVLVGNHSHDDAGVFRLSEDSALVQTIDFFTPVVDDPVLFGRIAATNSLSDIYAMGGVPITALNLLATPAGVLDPKVVSQMLDGGQQVMDDAHTSIIGGHTIDDPEPKMGYAVTGLVHPDHIWRNDTAKPGDYLYLTKPIGTGVIIKAIKDGAVLPAVEKEAIEMMATSNRVAKDALVQVIGDPSSCTDVTGFGLLGHLWEMALGAGVRMTLGEASVPILKGARALAEQDQFPAGSRRNWDFVAPHVNVNHHPAGALEFLLADAVTSGGLLFTVPKSRHTVLEEGFKTRNVPLWRIGVVASGEPGIDVQ